MEMGFSIGQWHGLEILVSILQFRVATKVARRLKKGGGRKVNVVVEGPFGEFSNSEKIGKGKY